MIVADVADPPSRLLTVSAAAVEVAAPKVQETVNVVAFVCVTEPQVPSAVAATLTPDSKFVPTMVNAVVVLAGEVAGVTLVIVGPAPMRSSEVVDTAETFTTPPLALVTV
jgi:hypothetical protein